jgi:pimeloyl-ACP methyl ester carboxylesterase
MESANHTGLVPTRIDLDNWVIDKALIGRAGVDEIMLDLLYDIPNQVPVFKAMQEFLRDRRPPTLVATGADDQILPEQAVRQILTDHPDAEVGEDGGHDVEVDVPGYSPSISPLRWPAQLPPGAEMMPVSWKLNVP